MAETTRLTQHIESYIDLSRSATQQAASLDTIASLIKKDQLTIQTLVKEMGMYLTTTDNVIRARGILLLGEVLARLSSKYFDDATVHSLIGFFSDRLADWRALRGALEGCLVLLRRKGSSGMVSETDAKAVARSYLQYLQVQSLGQYDRKLSFELLECLLERYGHAVVSLGDDLISGILESIDGEMDPHCLMLTFHIVELLPRLFPDPSGPFASCAEGLFEILSNYFPIHFTHPKDEGIDVKRDDLSTALMRAFSSSPLLEPFAIPLLLEKLSSSLPSAKVDSLKYLGDCIDKYGAERIAKHGGAIWSTLKDTLYISQENVFSFNPDSLDGLGFQNTEIAIEALGLLQKLIVQNCTLFVGLIVGDEDINKIFKAITNYKNSSEIPVESKQKLHAVGCILNVSAKASTSSCNRVFGYFFPQLTDVLGMSVRGSSQKCSINDIDMIAKEGNHGALYICIELLQACKYLIGGTEEDSSVSISKEETYCCLLQSFSASLAEVFSSVFMSTSKGTNDVDIYLGVKGLEILATFHGGFFPIPLFVFEKILQTFVAIVITDWSKTLLWKSTLKALVHIGSFVERFNESEKKESYSQIVVEKILASLNVVGMPLSLKLEALSDIGTSGPTCMLKITQELEEAIFDNLSNVYVHGSSSSADIALQLLQCYSNKVVPWIQSTGGFEEALLHFAVNILNQIDNSIGFSVQTNQRELLDVMMKAMKLVVASCSEGNQNKIIDKAYSVLSSRTSFPLKESLQNGFQIIDELGNISYTDEWILSLLTSVIIAVRPQAQIPNLRSILYLLTTTHLRGHAPSAQALGSLVNKLPQKSNAVQISSGFTLEEAVDSICNLNLWSFHNSCNSQINGGVGNDHKIGLFDLCRGASNSTVLQIQAISVLAWIGKGLVMRGHEKVRDITMVFLECLLSNEKKPTFPQEQGISGQSHGKETYYSVMKHAADAFQILMSDSETCLSRHFHSVLRPLYKQRFFSTMMPLLQSMMLKADSASRPLLLRASAHIIINTPLIVVMGDAKKLIPILLDGLSILKDDIVDKDILYGLLLVLSGILTDKSGQEAINDSAHIIINRLVGLIGYPHMMLVRETAIQCLVALSALPHTRIFPMRTQVLQAVAKALDDSKRAVRLEAVRCRQAWV